MSDASGAQRFNGDLLRALRRKQKLRQKNLAPAIGVTVSAVSKWESGAAQPSDEHIEELTRVLGQPPEGWHYQATIANNRPPNGSGVESYRSWNDPAVENIISSTRFKITFIDTWFDEGASFIAAINRGTKAGEKRSVLFEMYLLSAQSPFGGYRLREIAPQISSSDEELARQYQEAFNAGIFQARRYLGNSQIDLRIYKYDFMPGIRLLVIDDEKYLFSWFPLGTVSAENVCFCVTANSPLETDQTAIEHLRRQLAVIVEHSEPVVS